MVANVLTIAGSDPSGGAGIQADLKTFSACGVYGMSVITAITAQNTAKGVQRIMEVPVDLVADQIKLLKEDIQIDAIKSGMLSNSEIIHAVAKQLADIKAPYVLDPVMVCKNGEHMLKPGAAITMREVLLPLATVVTPNLPEAAVLLETNVASSVEEMKEQAKAILDLGPKAVVIKGGHLGSSESPDILVTKEKSYSLESVRYETKNTHGTGCTLSAAIASFLGKGLEIHDAVTAAKAYLAKAIKESEALNVGSGHGPVHHFSSVWD